MLVAAVEVKLEDPSEAVAEEKAEEKAEPEAEEAEQALIQPPDQVRVGQTAQPSQPVGRLPGRF